jgi:hypothetical protein
LQEQEKMASTSNLTLNSIMMSHLAGGSRGGGGSGPMSASTLVSKLALAKLSTVENVYFAEVVQQCAREIFPFPATKWKDLKEISRLLAPPNSGQLTKEEVEKGAVIVSQLLRLFIPFFSIFFAGLWSYTVRVCSPVILKFKSFILQFNYFPTPFLPHWQWKFL